MRWKNRHYSNRMLINIWWAQFLIFQKSDWQLRYRLLGSNCFFIKRSEMLQKALKIGKGTWFTDRFFSCTTVRIYWVWENTNDDMGKFCLNRSWRLGTPLWMDVKTYNSNVWFQLGLFIPSCLSLFSQPSSVIIQMLRGYLALITGQLHWVCLRSIQLQSISVKMLWSHYYRSYYSSSVKNHCEQRLITL